jgi:hypothetical protein
MVDATTARGQSQLSVSVVGLEADVSTVWRVGVLGFVLERAAFYSPFVFKSLSWKMRVFLS